MKGEPGPIGPIGIPGPVGPEGSIKFCPEKKLKCSI